MVGRRQRARRNWPDYLIARKKAQGLYYYWRDPRTGREYGLGYDFAEAASQAREANSAILAERQAPVARLADRLSGQNGQTMAEWLDKFDAILLRRPGKRGMERSPNTLKTDRSRIKHLREHFGEALLAGITTKHCNDLIERFIAEGKQRQAQSMRSFMIDCFSEAEAAGWIPRDSNPASITRAPQVNVKRARLTLEQFMAYLDQAKSGYPWLVHALQLAILTGQRIGDVSNIKYSDAHDGFLHVVQDKEGHKLRIPLALGLPQIGLTIEQVIQSSRRFGVVGSKYVLHHTVARTLCKRGDRVHEQAISKAFLRLTQKISDEQRKAWWGDKDPPTFHELRSLSKRLYDEIGVDTKTLLGHSSEEMAAKYRDMRGDWMTVKLPEIKQA